MNHAVIQSNWEKNQPFSRAVSFSGPLLYLLRRDERSSDVLGIFLCWILTRLQLKRGQRRRWREGNNKQRGLTTSIYVTSFSPKESKVSRFFFFCFQASSSSSESWGEGFDKVRLRKSSSFPDDKDASLISNFAPHRHRLRRILVLRRRRRREKRPINRAAA